MRLVIFANTILQLNSLNITVSVQYLSWSKVDRKERRCPFLFVCLFACFTLQNKSTAEHLVPSCQCHVWSLKQAEESVWISMIKGITTAPDIKVLKFKPVHVNWLEFQPSPRVANLTYDSKRRLKSRLTDDSQKLPLRYHYH